MIDFFKTQFDKILLSSLLILAGMWVLHVQHDPSDSRGVEQAWGVLTTILGALITTITGRLFAGRKSDNGNGQPAKPEPKP